MSWTAACPGPRYFRDSGMSRTPACPGQRHVQDSSMSRTPACPEQRHVQDSGMFRTAACPGPRHVQDSGMSRTAHVSAGVVNGDCRTLTLAHQPGLNSHSTESSTGRRETTQKKTRKGNKLLSENYIRTGEFLSFLFRARELCEQGGGPGLSFSVPFSPRP